MKRTVEVTLIPRQMEAIGESDYRVTGYTLEVDIPDDPQPPESDLKWQIDAIERRLDKLYRWKEIIDCESGTSATYSDEINERLKEVERRLDSMQSGKHEIPKNAVTCILCEKPFDEYKDGLPKKSHYICPDCLKKLEEDFGPHNSDHGSFEKQESNCVEWYSSCIKCGNIVKFNDDGSCPSCIKQSEKKQEKERVEKGLEIWSKIEEEERHNESTQEWQWPDGLPIKNGEQSVLYMSGYETPEELKENGWSPWWESIWYLCNPPKNAKYAQCYLSGTWHWFSEDKKIISSFSFIPHPDWKNSLLKRPEGLK